MLKLKCFMCLIMMYCCVSSALAQTPSCEKPQIFFVNGIWKDTPLDPLKGAAELQGVLLEQGIAANQYGLGGNTKFAVRPFWNPGDGALDVLEVFLNQRKAGKALAEAINDANLLWIKRLAGLLGANKPGVAFQQYIDELTAQIGSEIGKRRPVIIMAHSEGNILTNRAVAALLEKNPDLDGWVSIVGVGVADDKRVGQGYRYVTNNIDLVIGPLVGALPSNFTVGSSGSEDLSGHDFIEYYLSKSVLGSGLFNGGRSLRSVVGALSKEAFERVKCTGTQINLTNTSTPLTANLDSSSSFNFLVTPDIKINDKKLVGKVTVKSSTGTTLCSSEISPDGTGACSATFTGAPRTESVSLVYEGRGGYIDSNGAADVKLVRRGGTHWAGSYRATSCTALPADSGGGQWYWENPCYAIGPTAGAANGFFYFDDVSSTVVLGGDSVRTVMALGFNSKLNEFRLSLPTGYSEPGYFLSLSNAESRSVESLGTRVTTFKVTNRTETVLSGTFHVDTVSGYRLVTSLRIFEYWKTIPTVADGVWSANLKNSPMPQTKMNGFDFCFYDNSAANQGTFPNPLNISMRPSWAGGFIANGCQFDFLGYL